MVFRHTVSEDIVRGVVVAEEFGLLDTQLHLADDDRFVVMVVVVVAAGGISHQQFLAQLAVLAVLEDRRERGALGREEPLTRMTGCRSFFCSRSLGTLRQTFQLRLVFHKILVGVGLCHHVVAELQGQQRELLIDSFEALFLVLRQVGAVVCKGLVGLRHKAHLLGVETQLLTLVVNKLHALEEFVVEDDAVAQLREHRTHLLGDRVHLVVAVRLEDIEEHALYAVQQKACAVERHNRVLEGRLGFVIHDGIYLRLVLRDSRLKSRQIVLVLHLIKSRHAIRGVRLI